MANGLEFAQIVVRSTNLAGNQYVMIVGLKESVLDVEIIKILTKSKQYRLQKRRFFVFSAYPLKQCYNRPMIAALHILFILNTQSLGLPPNLLASICFIESKYEVTAIHHDDGGSDSLGVCQIKHSTAKSLGFKGTVKDLMEPKNNIYYADLYLRSQIKRYHDATKAVVAYNKGNSKGLTHSQYSDKVLKYWRESNECGKRNYCERR